MEAKVQWQGNLRFTGIGDKGLELPLGSHQAIDRNYSGFRPMELFAIGIAGCTAMDVISIMLKKRQDVTDFNVQVHIDRAEEHPKVFTKAVINYHFYGHGINEAAVVRSIELSATRYCPAQAMMGEIMPIDLKYYIYDDQDNGEQILVTSSVFTVPELENSN